MRLTRVYQAGKLNETLQLNALASHHLAKVLRAKVKDQCIVFDGEGLEAQYQILAIHKNSIELIKVKDLVNDIESTIDIHLCQAIAKGDKMDWVLQKAVELGVTEITPMFSERCDVRIDDNRLAKKIQHWQAVIVSACQQSGRAVVPKLTQPGVLFNRVIQQPDLPETKLIFSPTSIKPILSVPKKEKYLIAVGPEGGFSDNELASAISCGFNAYSLGKRVLRTETAAIAAIANLQCLFDL